MVLPGAIVRALANDALTLGRGDDADVRIDDGRVSRLHASVEPVGDGYRVRDLDSTNGTYLNGRPVKARQLLASGDEIKVGDHSMFFLDVSEGGLQQAVWHARSLLTRRERGDRDRAEELLAHVDREAGVRFLTGISQMVEEARLAMGDADEAILSPAFATMPGRVAQAPNLPAAGKLTFLFTDIQDSTPLTDRLGDEAWMALLEVHHSIVRRVAAGYGGYEVKAQGDGFMIVFRDARQGVQAACEMQRRFAEHNVQHGDRLLLVRMGLHAGEVVREGDDFYGRNVIIATRVSASARGGEILVTDAVRDELDGAATSEPREIALKGFDERFRVHAVAWEAGGP